MSYITLPRMIVPAFAALCLTVSLPALAQDNGAATTSEVKEAPTPDHKAAGDHKGFFSKLDKNGDAKISQDEFVEEARERFKKMDTNSDGFVDKAESDSMKKAWRDKMHNKMDKDNHGELDENEQVPEGPIPNEPAK